MASILAVEANAMPSHAPVVLISDDADATRALETVVGFLELAPVTTLGSAAVLETGLPHAAPYLVVVDTDHADGQAAALTEIFTNCGWIVDGIERDLSGRERFIIVSPNPA